MKDDDDDGVWIDILKPEHCRIVTLDELLSEGQRLVARGRIAQSAVDALRASYEARAQPGDQWCEWVLGTEPLMQMGGIALMRNGALVWAHQTWIS